MSKKMPNVVEQTEAMQKEVKYLSTILQLNELRTQVYGLNQQVMNSIKEHVDKTIQFLDAGIRRNEVYAHLGLLNNGEDISEPVEYNEEDVIEDEEVTKPIMKLVKDEDSTVSDS